jgi:hypothetical protein
LFRWEVTFNKKNYRWSREEILTEFKVVGNGEQTTCGKPYSLVLVFGSEVLTVEL